MTSFIKQLLGNNTNLKDGDIKDLTTGVPCYFLGEYYIYVLSGDGPQYILLYPKLCIGLKRLIGQYRLFSKAAKFQCALCLNYLSERQRKVLLDENIPFVFSEGQAYLPSWQVSILPDKFREPPYLSPKMAPDAQALCLLLYYRYLEGQEEIGRQEVCGLLNLRESRCGQILEEFMAMRIIDGACRDGETIRPVYNPRYFLLESFPRMKSPVEDIIYVDRIPEDMNVPRSGIPALAEFSMICALADDPGYAVSRSDAARIPKERRITQQDFLDFGGEGIEVWSYDPSVLAKDGRVDDISILLNLDRYPDERAQAQLDKKIRQKHGLPID